MAGNKNWPTSQTIEYQDWFTYVKNLNSSNSSSSDPFTKEVDYCVFQCNQYAFSSNDILDKPFTLEELRKVRKNLKDNKTSGLDAISNEMIECCIDIHGSWFVRLFNSVYQSGCFPLYFKSSTRDDPNNYRDISV